jgi:hypothetical protein
VVSTGILSPRKGDPGAEAGQLADKVEAPSSSQVLEEKEGGASLGLSNPSSVPGPDRAISGPSGLEGGGGVVGSPAPQSGGGVVPSTVSSGAQVSLGSPPLLVQSTRLVSSSKSRACSGSLYGDDEALFSPDYMDDSEGAGLGGSPARGTVLSSTLPLRLFPFLVHCLGLLSLAFSHQFLRPVGVMFPRRLYIRATHLAIPWVGTHLLLPWLRSIFRRKGGGVL